MVRLLKPMREVPFGAASLFHRQRTMGRPNARRSTRHMSKADIDWMLELLAPLGAVHARRMFGGHGFYLDARMFALEADGGLYLKVDAASKPAFRAEGSAPFVYEGGGRSVQMSYWSAPDAALDSAEAMLPWARLALLAAERSGKKAPAVTRPRRKPRPAQSD